MWRSCWCNSSTASTPRRRTCAALCRTCSPRLDSRTFANRHSLPRSWVRSRSIRRTSPQASVNPGGDLCSETNELDKRKGGDDSPWVNPGAATVSHRCYVAPQPLRLMSFNTGEVECAAPDWRTSTASKLRSCFSPWERFTMEPANTLRLARCRVSWQPFSHRGERPVWQRDCWLMPQTLNRLG